MYTIASVEDSPLEYEALSKAIDRFNAENKVEIRLVHFKSAELFLSSFACNFDAIFLDIALPGISGMDLAKSIRKTDKDVTILFITSLAQFAINGYEVDAFDFIVKPIVYGDFEFKMKRLVRRLSTKESAKVVISTSAKQVAVSSSEIYFVEISGHTILYHTAHGDFEAYDSLRNVESKLGAYNFVKCNSCYLVNLAYVDGVEGFDLLLKDHRLAISHPKKKDFMKTLNAYYGRVGK